MNQSVREIVANLDNIESLETQGELARLDENVVRLFAVENPESGIGASLRVFELFPEQDSFGIFWSIVHGLETLSGYELPLIESVKRQPSLFGLLMINRLMNGGVTEIHNNDLLDILKTVAADKQQSEEIRAEAQDFVKFQECKN